MAISLSQSFTAVGPNITSSFLASGGSAPYTYSVLPNGAGGTIASTGVYTAPSAVPSNPAYLYDTIQAVDSSGNIARAQILVGTPLLLFCDIIQNGMGLANGRVYLWDQKIFQPNDYDPYIAVSVLSCKPFANINAPDGSGSGLVSQASVNMYAVLNVDIMSRGPAARDRKEEVILALNSNYSEAQQEANSFYIGRIPVGGQFVNLSGIDGAAIPYRFNISVAMQYVYLMPVSVPYINTFETVQLTTQA
jgi:hypothetical protein